jgi:DNA (cytosine-5)-methyltransferase 1
VNFVHPASNKCIHPTQDRALTLREGARLQSFDDAFRFAGTSRNAIAKQIGNAVPPLLGEVLGRAVAAALGGAEAGRRPVRTTA